MQRLAYKVDGERRRQILVNDGVQSLHQIILLQGDEILHPDEASADLDQLRGGSNVLCLPNGQFIKIYPQLLQDIGRHSAVKALGPGMAPLFLQGGVIQHLPNHKVSIRRVIIDDRRDCFHEPHVTAINGKLPAITKRTGIAVQALLGDGRILPQPSAKAGRRLRNCRDLPVIAAEDSNSKAADAVEVLKQLGQPFHVILISHCSSPRATV